MLLLKIKLHKIILPTLLFLLSICLTTNIAFSKEINSINLHKAFSKKFAPASKENKHLLDGWNEYILKVRGYSNAAHLKVIEKLTMDYAKAIKALNEKYEKEREQDKINYSSKWLDELVERFGKEFVCNNRRAILLNLMIAFHRNDAKNHDRDANDIISKEMILYLAYERYLGLFMDYYNELSTEDQNKMKAWKEVAQQYLSVTNKSHFAQTYYGMFMENRMDDQAMQKENHALYTFFKESTLPFSSWAFSEARKDIDMFIELYKMK